MAATDARLTTSGRPGARGVRWTVGLVAAVIVISLVIGNLRSRHRRFADQPRRRRRGPVGHPVPVDDLDRPLRRCPDRRGHGVDEFLPAEEEPGIRFLERCETPIRVR